MSEEWYYNLKTGQIEQGKQTHGSDRLGPYPDAATAKRALDIVQERNAVSDSAAQEDDTDGQ